MNSQTRDPIGERFMEAACTAILEQLAGHTPVKPVDVAIPDGLRGLIPEKRGDDWVSREWGWLALTGWCLTAAREAKRNALIAQGYDLTQLGVDFYQYLIKDSNANGTTARPSADAVLEAHAPQKYLRKTFGRYLISEEGPFQHTVRRKLSNRFNYILSHNDDFVNVGSRNRKWGLTGSAGSGLGLAGTMDQLQSYLLTHIGRLNPYLYSEKASTDPIIYEQDALQVARAAIEFSGPLNAWQLAEACSVLLPEDIWAQTIRAQSDDDIPPDVPDLMAEERLRAEFRAIVQSSHDDGPAPPDPTTLAIQAWNSLDRDDQIIAAGRVFMNPLWTRAALLDWSCKTLRPDLRLTKNKIQTRSGTDDEVIWITLVEAVLPFRAHLPSAEAIGSFIYEFAEAARKTLTSPPHSWVDNHPEENKKPPHP